MKFGIEDLPNKLVLFFHCMIFSFSFFSLSVVVVYTGAATVLR